MTKKKMIVLVLALVMMGGIARADDALRIVGSSTVFPFSTSVAERLAAATKFPAPIVESTGTGGGLKLFCSGLGTGTPDFTNASRQIKKTEFQDCVKNGVRNVTEIQIGFDGIVFANSRESPQISISKEQIFLALAARVPVNEVLQDNPYTHWNQIDDELPNVKIQVFGPPPTSGTRDAFSELVMEEACHNFEALSTIEDNDERRAACTKIREDGVYIDAGENDNLIVSKLLANPATFGIFGFSFLDQNSSKIQGQIIDGVAPTFDNIADGKYNISRSLYFYVKNDHVNRRPGMREYIEEFTSERAWGEDGYLAEKGLIPLPDDVRREQKNNASSLKMISPM